ncbi:1-deoxy-D-xylulose-5-phosphate reductoisomerase [Acutalibacter sp. 1XD8-36]|uniref:1-deoxy-D-xylulose-5-phosphate reductoisomerase n=1 Tax=Acutalibacter sp. 1XD8-36 TaxID=2320852 RepID=UPI0014137787|nr:1-deoxy-D-xylulose-5-phosphate reductoisomerase [Acutalibacter sp. 1XD8-36]NBJ88222.1 1-deoxy-D-xylulose-5-phosphate reductoisomerase [Acutalibacter sp. 1XD8-36]
MKTLSILGSTGSIGTQALKVVRELNRTGRTQFRVAVMAAHHNVELLEQQVREFSPEAVAVYDSAAAADLRIRLRDMDVKVLEGIDGLCEAAAWEGVDITLNSVVGMVGLRPTLAAIKAKKTLALANKETLVAGGALVMEAAKQNGVDILPVDSEHSAIFQCLQGNNKRELRRMLLTASGGPFFGRTREELENVTPEQALAHPNWSMGAKVTIDSATMMNKGLEVMEARWLFDVLPDKIQVVVHRESIVHSMVEYDDRSVIAQLGVPDMCLPIQYALTYPERLPSPVGELDLFAVQSLSFYPPDLNAFPCLDIAIRALKRGGLAPAAVNGANEEAVSAFLQGRLGFMQIPELCAQAMERQPDQPADNVEDVLEADIAAREFVKSVLFA